MPLNTQIDVKNPSAFTIRNHAFGARPSTACDVRGKAASQPLAHRSAQPSTRAVTPSEAA